MFLFFQAKERDYYLEQVASFQYWTKLKRGSKKNVSIRKGEHGFCVLVPVEYTLYERDEEGNYVLNQEHERIQVLDENGNIKKGITFKLGYVFDVNQTNAKETGIYKKFAYRNTENEIEETIFDKLLEAAKDNYKVYFEFKNLGAAGEAEGFSYILSSFFGINNKSELYIKSWGNNADEFKATMENISNTAKKAMTELKLESI